MLVLNTTSPVASPSAPAAWPRNTVPSSSAKSASIYVLAFLHWRRGPTPPRPFADASLQTYGLRLGVAAGAAVGYLSNEAVTRLRSAATTRIDADQRR